MLSQVKIPLELLVLARQRVKVTGTLLKDELARRIACEAVLNLDPEQAYLLDESACFSSNDALVAAFAVNDLVVNGCRIDIRVLEEDEQVAINSALIGTSYLKLGTLVVKMQGPSSGSVVGYVSTEQWQSLSNITYNESVTRLKPHVSYELDLSQTLSMMIGENTIDAKIDAETTFKNECPPKESELIAYVVRRSELSISSQREIIEGTLASPKLWDKLAAIISLWSCHSIKRVLAQEAVWHERIERLAEKLAVKCNYLSKDQIKQLIALVGETFGGQTESPEFRKALLSRLAYEELAQNLSGTLLVRAKHIVEAVLAGSSVLEVIAKTVKNRTAIDLAVSIKQQRNISGNKSTLKNFMTATADELVGAFKLLALTPAYATHSQDPNANIAAVNEVLNMLEVGDLADSIKELEASM